MPRSHEARPQTIKMARQGKIARLPATIREELNLRLMDGESARKILDWLNGLPRVQEILKEDFEGLFINDANLSDWRRGGFLEWEKQRGRIDRTKELARYAAEQSKAGGQSIADGAAAIAAGKLLELLEAIDAAVPAVAIDGEEAKPLPAEQVASIAYALSALRSTEQTDVKLQLAGKALKQKERQIDLDEQKFRRETAGMVLKCLKDDRAKQIEAGSGTNAEKIEIMGQHIFGDLWKAQPAPGTENPPK